MEREWWLWRKRERRERRFGGADLDGEREREKGAQKRRPVRALAPRRFWSMTIQLRICSRICSWGPSFCVFSDGSLFTCDFIILLGCFSFSAGCVEGGQKHNATKRPPEKSSQPQEPSLVSVAQEQRPPGDLRLQPGPDRGLVCSWPCWQLGPVYTRCFGFNFQPEKKQKNKKKK